MTDVIFTEARRDISTGEAMTTDTISTDNISEEVIITIASIMTGNMGITGTIEKIIAGKLKAL